MVLAVLHGLFATLIGTVLTSAVPAELAAAALAGAALAAMLVLVTSLSRVSRVAAGVPAVRRVSALRERSWRAAFQRQRDPDAAGRARPRAPSAAPAAAAAR
ncbi:MAG TPA: DUF6412 domain-containing protein [Streptosporangiaceae bacterium]|nr:DUF6412 domain-containing protein [Streptosporangiaceae bacterium]